MYYKKSGYRKPTEDDLSPKAYRLLNDAYAKFVESGLKLSEIRLVCNLLRWKIEKTVADCAIGGRED